MVSTSISSGVCVLATGLKRIYFEDVRPSPSIFITIFFLLYFSLHLLFLLSVFSFFSFPFISVFLFSSFSSSSSRSSPLTGHDVTLTSSITFAVCASAGEGMLRRSSLSWVVRGALVSSTADRLPGWPSCAIGWLCDYASYSVSLCTLSSPLT